MDYNGVNWFEIPVMNMDRAKKFYTSVFGKELSEMDMGPNQVACFPMPSSKKETGVGGALIKSPSYKPTSVGTTVYFNA